MRRILGCLVAVLILSAAEQAAAQIRTGNDLMRAVAADRRTDAGSSQQEDWFLSGYLSGLVAGIANTNRDICPPAGSTREQWKRVVIQFLEANPADLHLPASLLVAVALAKAFPCRRP